MLLAMGQFIIIVTVCVWYFSHGTDKEGSGGVIKAIWWTFRYHLGSLAFGSLILAIVWAIRIIFEYMRKKFAVAEHSNPLVKIGAWVCSCCLYCLNRFIKFLNKNAYIQVALKSTNFCTSAWNAFILILRNGAKYGFVAWVGTVFIYLGKFFIASLSGLVAYIIANYWKW